MIIMCCLCLEVVQLTSGNASVYNRFTRILIGRDLTDGDWENKLVQLKAFEVGVLASEG